MRHPGHHSTRRWGRGLAECGVSAGRYRWAIVMMLAMGVLLMHAFVAGSADSAGSMHSAHSGSQDSGAQHSGAQHSGMVMAAAHEHMPPTPATPTHPRSPGDHQGAVMTAATASSGDSHMGDGDHCELGHPCMFVLGGGVPLPPVILVLLVWGFAALPVLVGMCAAVARRLGRPPPWAMPTHLTLSVIRC